MFLIICKKAIMNDLVFIIYDSIKNSVFAGQVLQPILRKMDENVNQKAYLISFEKEKITQEEISRYIPKKKNLIFIQLKRLPFLGKISLYYCVFQLKKQISQFKNEYLVISRGALAGWIFIRTIAIENKNLCISFTVQARGLLPEEYEYTHYQPRNSFFDWLNAFLKTELTKIEQEAYKPNYKFNNFKIESITIALEDHLVEKYKVSRDCITIASYDVPSPISEDKLLIWRHEIRKTLNILPDTHVYCYNGSLKIWQGADLVVEFFKKELSNRKDIFLLVLTQDKHEFESLLKANKIDTNYYKVLYVEHSEIYKFLAACDIGLIFRKPHIISWVSRPIKALEYKSAALKIIHNNTVKWLIDKT